MEYVGGVVAALSGVGFNFLIQILLTRHLGIAGFGVFALWRNTTMLSSALGLFGVDFFSLKHLSAAKGRESPADIQRFRWRAATIVAAAAALSSLMIGYFFLPDGFGFEMTAATAIAVALLTLFSAGNRALRGDLLSIVIERSALPGLFLILVTLSTIGIVDGEASDFAIWFFGVALTALSAALLLSFLTNNHSGEDSLSIEVEDKGVLPTKITHILSGSIPFFMVTVAGYLSSRAPLIFAGFLLTAGDVGRIALMQALAGLVSVSMYAVNLISGPKIAAAFGSGDDFEVRRLFRETRTFATIIGLLAASTIWIAHPLIGWLTGEADVIEPNVLLVLLIANTIAVLVGASDTYLLMTGSQTVVAKFANISVAFKVLALYPLISSFGIIGIAFAELMQFAIYGVLITYIARGTFRGNS